MALQATLLAGLAKAASDKAVQAAAVRLAQDVYGRILPGRKVPEAHAAHPLDALAPAIAQLATKEEVAVAFSLLQAEMDRRHRRVMRMLLALGALQILTIIAIVIG
jgi:hypothetical protein